MLKICSKENLILGGIVMAVGTPFFYVNMQKVLECLLLVFCIAFILQCFRSSIFNLDKKLLFYPKISYYLCSIGWIPYFYICFSVLLFLIEVFWEISDNGYKIIDDVFYYIGITCIPVSLGVAFFGQKCKKYFSKM